MKLLNQAKKLPDRPGVYFFLNKKGRVLYIGRATSLRKRVQNYFQRFLEPRLREMVGKTVRIKHKKTDTILESIILEANLIKKYWPKYNVKEKDDRSFVYIIIPKTDYPRPFIVRGREIRNLKLEIGNFYLFGPYQSLGLIKAALRIIRRIFPYSTCKPFSGKACFNYQIGLCPGVCVGKVSKKDYQKNIKNIIAVLEGRKFQNDLRLKHIQDVALLSKEEVIDDYSKFNRVEGYDVSHFAGKEASGSMAVFINGEKDSSQYRLFKIKTAKAKDDLGALVEIVERRLRHREWPYPDLILIDGGKPQVDIVFKLLKKKFARIPLVGISKLAGDKLVFPKNTKKSVQELIQSSKSIFLNVRNEAHRFAIKYHKKLRGKI